MHPGAGLEKRGEAASLPLDPPLFSALLDRVGALCGAVVNYEDTSGLTLRLAELRLRPEQHLHHHPYCLHAKQHGHAQACSRNKARSVALARKRRTPFAGRCPFGMWDLAWPVHEGAELVGVLYGGSWVKGAPLAALRGKAFGGSPPRPHRPADEKELRRWMAFLASYLELAVRRAKASGAWPGKKRPASWYVDGACEAMRVGYTEELSLAEVASRLGVNAHHLGQLLVRARGRPFRSLLLEQRLSAAKELLLQRLPVGQVAARCGFSDPNYFTAVFSRREGVPPRRWGAEHRRV